MQSKHSLVMLYIGSELSINHCYYRNTRRYKKRVVDWMAELAKKASRIPPVLRSTDVTIELSGTFKDKRSVPDLHNLHKVIADALANGLGLTTDVDFRFEDKGYVIIKTLKPALSIMVIFREVKS